MVIELVERTGLLRTTLPSWRAVSRGAGASDLRHVRVDTRNGPRSPKRWRADCQERHPASRRARTAERACGQPVLYDRMKTAVVQAGNCSATNQGGAPSAAGGARAGWPDAP